MIIFIVLVMLHKKISIFLRKFDQARGFQERNLLLLTVLSFIAMLFFLVIDYFKDNLYGFLLEIFMLFSLLIMYLFIKHKLLKVSFLVNLFLLLCMFGILFGYVLSSSFIEGFVFVITFLILVVFLELRFVYVTLWLGLFYSLFLYINIYYLDEKYLNAIETFYIFVLHMLISVFLSFILYQKKVDQRLLFIRKRKLLLEKKRLDQKDQELSELACDIEKLSNVDPLTKLRNRSSLLYKLELEFKKFLIKKEYLVIALIDVDNFKNINDVYGHQKGDMVLINIANALKKYLRYSDIFGRYDGKKFMVVFTNTSIDKIKAKVTLMCEVVEDTVKCDERSATISIGVAESKRGDDTYKLISNANDALCEAKKAGKNRVRYAV